MTTLVDHYLNIAGGKNRYMTLFPDNGVWTEDVVCPLNKRLVIFRIVAANRAGGTAVELSLALAERNDAAGVNTDTDRIEIFSGTDDHGFMSTTNFIRPMTMYLHGCPIIGKKNQSLYALTRSATNAPTCHVHYVEIPA